jgi:hypothetical protein
MPDRRSDDDAIKDSDWKTVKGRSAKFGDERDGRQTQQAREFGKRDRSLTILQFVAFQASQSVE